MLHSPLAPCLVLAVLNLFFVPAPCPPFLLLTPQLHRNTTGDPEMIPDAAKLHRPAVGSFDRQALNASHIVIKSDSVHKFAPKSVSRIGI